MSFGLLTRVPLPYPAFDTQNTRPAAFAAWAYPLVGFVVALATGLTGWIASGLGMPPAIAALLALLTGILCTGAMHEDGLADCADGFWGGWTVARRLEIMKDSQIGTYGVIALVVSLGLRWSALTVLLSAGAYVPALVAACVASRAVMVGVMYALPNARGAGLSKQTGHPPRPATMLAAAIGGLALCLLPSALALAAFVMTGIAACGVALVAKAKIGGQTGDVLGATQQVVEIAILLTCLTILA